ncbi:MAG: MFS transporter [Anaerolineae bacterium]|nr:MFS transporter [Phycisphaerae bacterium]
MSGAVRGWRSHVTLVCCTLLHAFTHALGTLLVPLYLLIVADLHLRGVRQASLVITIYGFVYCIASYVGGLLADRFDRRFLLSIRLAGNALAIIGFGLTRRYEVLIALGVLAGLFGTLFHPSANSLVPSHYPKNPGLAIGILGMGSGLGFFAGPQFAGWRAENATWHFGSIADWQRPCIEFGLIALGASVVFLFLLRETRAKHSVKPDPNARDAMLPARLAVEAIVTDITGSPETGGHAMGKPLRRRVIAIAAILGFRDFAGVASLTIVSLYLQKAHGYDTHRAGFTVGTMMLLSVLINPLATWISPGTRRLPALAISVISGGVFLATAPFVRLAYFLPVMAMFQVCQLGSYAISDAAMLERVDSAVRGRVVGLFLTLAGTFASLSPFAMGLWVDLLGERAKSASGFIWPFATLGAMMIIAAFATPLIAGLAKKQEEQEPQISQIAQMKTDALQSV